MFGRLVMVPVEVDASSGDGPLARSGESMCWAVAGLAMFCSGRTTDGAGVCDACEEGEPGGVPLTPLPGDALWVVLPSPYDAVGRASSVGGVGGGDGEGCSVRCWGERGRVVPR